MNIDVGVRFGVSLDQGKRCYMEDTAACLTNAFNIRHEDPRNPSEGPPEDAQPALGGAPAPRDQMDAVESGPSGGFSARAEAPETAASVSPGAAAYFGVFDGAVREWA